MNDAATDSTPDRTPTARCDDCVFLHDRLVTGRCVPGDARVEVESGRQIDGFFRVNPELAECFLDDPFRERRAIAVRYSPHQRIVECVADPDESVRRAAAYRLPVDLLESLVHDSDREARITVADRLPPERLECLSEDADHLVRTYFARRLPAGRLFRMISVEDRQVRETVAERLPQVSLILMPTILSRRSGASLPGACRLSARWPCSMIRIGPYALLLLVAPVWTRSWPCSMTLKPKCGR